jgi:hypothetical protein
LVAEPRMVAPGHHWSLQASTGRSATASASFSIMVLASHRSQPPADCLQNMIS